MMYLEKFMNENGDWQAKLAVAPYFIETKQDGEYFILKYNQILSDFSRPEVREARGSIFRRDENGRWVVVCFPFVKFMNYGEKYSAVNQIDWESASVQQKVDGSLIKFWCDRGVWFCSTNGTIFAGKASATDSMSYLDLVIMALEENGISYTAFCQSLDPHYCYMFELTTPFNRIVVRYEGYHLWYLGRRNIETLQEDSQFHDELRAHVKFPEHYNLHSLAACIDMAAKMGVDEEGYVVCDAHYNRIKVKGNEYLRLHKLRGNGALTVLRVVEMWQNESIDDFIAYYPEYNEFVNKVLGVIKNLIQIADIAYKTIKSYENINSRRTFARYANTYIQPLRAYLFAQLDNKCANSYEYYKSIRARSLASHIATVIETNQVGVSEDE